VPRRKFTKADFAAMNKLNAGVRYPPDQGRAQLHASAARKARRLAKRGRRSAP
jgi:hypothetical protein